MTFKAIIFDCDGVLMDSEVVCCKLSAQYLMELGISISVDEYMDRYMGKNLGHALVDCGFNGNGFREIERTHLFSRAFAKQLKAIPGVDKVLSNLSIPYAIASGSSLERLHKTLEITKLDRFFSKDKVFSVEQVARPKPAPDVFLLAAEKLGILPSECLVIEDGTFGAKGALEAGMHVYGFSGASHMTEKRIKKLKDVGVKHIFGSMAELSLAL